MNRGGARIGPGVVGLVLGVMFGFLAGWSGPAMAADAEPAPVELEEPAAGGWQPAVDVRCRAGYKDNVTLSSFAPDPSSFLGVGLDAFLWRPLGVGGSLEFFLMGDHRQYLAAADITKEQTLFSLLELERPWGERRHVAGAAEYAYVDQVLDVSATEADLQRARVRGHTLTARPSVRTALGGGSLGFQVSVQRQLYADTLDDYWELAPRLFWEWPVTARTELSAGYEFAYDWYDTDPLRDPTGAPVPGTRRELKRHDLTLAVRQSFGADDRWRLTARLGGRLNRDTGSGYYDYLRPQAALRLRYRHAGWEIEGGARGSHYAYGVQTVGGPDGPARRRSELLCDLRGEREILRFLKVFVEYAYEQTFANQAAEEYHVNIVSAGVAFSF